MTPTLIHSSLTPNISKANTASHVWFGDILTLIIPATYKVRCTCILLYKLFSIKKSNIQLMCFLRIFNSQVNELRGTAKLGLGIIVMTKVKKLTSVYRKEPAHFHIKNLNDHKVWICVHTWACTQDNHFLLPWVTPMSHLELSRKLLYQLQN